MLLQKCGFFHFFLHLKCVFAKCEKLFTDFLEGGKYYEPSDDTVMETESCPPNNITVERLMAKLDLQMPI
jgi:hypothetical protein